MRRVYTPPASFSSWGVASSFSPSSPQLSCPQPLRPQEAWFLPFLDEAAAPPTQGLGLGDKDYPWWAASIITQPGLPPLTPPAVQTAGYSLDGFYKGPSGGYYHLKDYNVAATTQPQRPEGTIATAPFALPLAQGLAAEPFISCGFGPEEVPHLPLLRVEPASGPSSPLVDPIIDNMVEVKCEQPDDDDDVDDVDDGDYLAAAGLAVGYDCTSPVSSRPSTPAQPPLPSWPLASRLVTFTTSAPPSPAFLPPKKKRKTMPRQQPVDSHLNHDDNNDHINNGHCYCPDRRFYLYTTMPEKKKPIWVVFYCTHEHEKATARLTLTSTDSHASGAGEAVVAELVADLDLSWAAKVVVPHPDTGRDTAMVQHKWCFVCPDDTFNSRVFSASLVEPLAVESTMEPMVVTTVLGGLSVISTTSQRRTRRAGVERVCGSEFERRLVANCARHPPKRRHFLNGKGKGQRPRKPKDATYLLDELSKSVRPHEE